MFTNKKELEELKESISAQISGLGSSINQRLTEHENSLEKLNTQIDDIRERNNIITDKIRRDLKEIADIKTNFTTALNRVEALSRNMESSIHVSVKEIADKEIENIKCSVKQFKDVEMDLKNIVEVTNDLQLELSKFLSISQQINLVDFSLKSHKEDIENYERERSRLSDENERLKSIMAKMKRNRR